MRAWNRIALVGLSCVCIAGSVFGQFTSGQLGIGFYGSGIKLVGGTTDESMINYASGISLKYAFSNAVVGEITAGLGWVRPSAPDSHFKALAGAPYRTFIYPWSANLRFNMFPSSRVTPYAGFGAGLTHWNLRNMSGDDKWFPIPASGQSETGLQTHFSVVGSLGLVVLFSERFGMDLGLRYTHILDQKMDNIGTSYIAGGTGDINNGMMEVRLGFDFYIGGYRDTDGDGIPNNEDLCPKQAEDMDGFEDHDGCPDLDNDNDGIFDIEDQAPNLPEDMDGFQDEDGIPDLDNDGDGIPDTQDKCPNEPEDLDGYKDRDGCPELDNDSDGIPDLMDQCPNKPETFNGYQDEDGCPDEKPVKPFVEVGKSIVLPGVTFATGKAELNENAKIILSTVLESLRDNPEIRVEIRGYTDNTGSAAVNLNLSQRRAEAVRDYLVGMGITFGRLRAIGYGEANPIASNATVDGRAKNRRIEFVRLDE